ncbi:MBL fold metallo-hydrolase [Aquabacterium sp.]|uniref:MBL fold metallo-hydrolase n=1 Tax=Aquabacterium sp. TaxID=1872578 RepID=UPI002CD2239D|nr:MBL fold metallo-hydrolase [Aquabacterium sp.]HSW03581.1 MBL fold metallo-hydrolase [Aquabacterium sp.]
MSHASFASAADDREQIARLVELAPAVYGFVSDHDPNCGFVVGEHGVLVIDTRATPRLGRELITAIQSVTYKPVRQIFLTHYHAVRVLGTAAFEPRPTLIASSGTRQWIEERGQADYDSEFGRFPRLFQDHHEIPGLTRPDLVFDDELTVAMGGFDVQLMHIGRGHSRGDSVAWLPQQRVLFAGDLVENRCAVYAGDGYLREWSQTLSKLEALAPRVLLPGRGAPLLSPADALGAIAATRGFLDAVWRSVEQGRARGLNRRGIYETTLAAMAPLYGEWPVFQHVLPFDVCRAIEEQEAGGEPSIWTEARDRALWAELHG